MYAKDKKFNITCSDCKKIVSVAYSTYRGIMRGERVNKNYLCRKCIAKSNDSVFKKGHNIGVRFGYGQKEYRGEYTKERAEKSSIKLKGKMVKEKHWNWKGGISGINKMIRQSFKYKEWRKNVFERDNYTCQECGQIGGVLNADHIKPFSLFPELRLDINNGRTLCKECHNKIGWCFFKENNPKIVTKT